MCSRICGGLVSVEPFTFADYVTNTLNRRQSEAVGKEVPFKVAAAGFEERPRCQTGNGEWRVRGEARCLSEQYHVGLAISMWTALLYISFVFVYFTIVHRGLCAWTAG
jgi:hypothetical protein